MILVIRRAVLLGSAAFFCLLSVVAVLLWRGYRRGIPAMSGTGHVPAVVVIDPGHGGEDGGAVSPEGIEESGLNLEIAGRVRDLMRLMGQPVLMTREADVSIGDAGLDTVKARKASDIRKRVEIVNAQPDAVLLSIHQNSLPSSPVTWGAQAFWNRREGGKALAEQIQAALNAQINAGHEKQAREMDSGIYLMRHAEAPAALVECGFLSNFAETMRLLEASHQKKLAAAITAGYLRYAAGEEGP